MKKLFVCVLIVTALVVAYNVHTRVGGPTLRPEQGLPVLADYPAVSQALSYILLPGAYALWYLGMEGDTRNQLIATALISWWAWLTLARLTWSILGRQFGFYDLGSFHHWLRLAIPWRWPYRHWLRLSAWWKQHFHGGGATASWTGLLAMLSTPYKPGNSIPLGRATFAHIGLHQPIGIEGEGHAMLIGNTGSGKTRFLLSWIGSLADEASALVIDAGGQASDALASSLERRGHRVSVWAPFGGSNLKSARWNPLDEITRSVARHGPQAAVRVAKVIADALVPNQNETQPIFAEGARAYLLSEILDVSFFAPPERRNLVQVRHNLTLGDAAKVLDPKQDPRDARVDDLIARAAFDDGCGGAISSVIARGAGIMKSGKSRDGNPFRTTAIIATSFLDLPELAATIQQSDFTLEGLKTGNDCVFLRASVDEIRETLPGMMRVFNALTLFTFQDIHEHRKIPCAMFLDEAPSIGIANLDTAAANYRKDDIRLVVVTQDLPILEKAYPKGWRTLMGSAVVRIWLMNGEIGTLKTLCEEVGSRTVTERIEGGGWLARKLGLTDVPARFQRVERPLLYLQQARDYLDRDRGQAIATRTGKPPIRLKYDGYDQALPIWKFDHLPRFRQPVLKALTRILFERFWSEVRRPAAQLGGRA